MALKGKRQCQARMRALSKAFKPIGRQWGDLVVSEMKPKIPVKTGKSRRSVRVANNTMKKTTVKGRFTLYFRDAGTKPHDIVPRKAQALRFPIGGRTMFSRKVHQRGLRAHPFRERAAREALRRTPAAATVIKEWNRAA
jgi:hypothetical protein